MKLIKPFLTISGFTFISKILGFVRDILIAAFVGAGVIADVFFVAFRIPAYILVKILTPIFLGVCLQREHFLLLLYQFFLQY